ncbi:MAG: hypothetical protein IPK82_28835 [Polyangiaceae bacterium]|nr:hypothetical protein [Polyangiaceae bacterium]
MFRLRSKWIAAIFVLFFAGRAALAGPSARVVVVPTGVGDPVAARLIDELIAAGVTVEVTAAESASLEAMGRGRGAAAAVLVEPSRRSVRIWWLNAPAGQVDTVLSDSQPDVDAAARSLALRTVELLRPHWGTSASATSASAAVPAASAAAAVAAAPSATAPIHGSTQAAGPPNGGPSGVGPTIVEKPDLNAGPWPDNLTIYISPMILLRPATPLSPGGGGLWGFTKMVRPYFGVDVSALVPVVPSELSTANGKVKIADGAIGVALLARYPTKPSALHVWGGVGLAAGFMGYDAEVSSSAVQASDGIVAHALPMLRASLEWRAMPAVGVRADLFGAIARPRPVLEVVGIGDVALEEPLVGLGLGVNVWLP